MNNVAVPMDLSQARAPNWHQGNRGCIQGNATSFGPALYNNTTGPPWGSTNNACFECSQMGHFIWNCPQCHQACARANLINFNKEFNNYKGTEPADRVEELKNQLNTMSLDKKAKLTEEMEVAKDFPMAWSDWHWSSKVATTMCTYLLGNL